MMSGFPIRLSTFLLALTMPIAGCAGNDTRPPGASGHTGQATSQSQTDGVSPDCSGLSSLIEKRACYFRQDPALIDECERIHPMRCRPYREMHAAERELAEVERASIASARRAYADYTEGDAGYLSDLDAAARRSNAAWRAYREAQCALEPFAQGMTRDLSEDLTEACRVRMTRSRIDELKALYAPARTESEQP
jgi:hypothetical protein